MGVSVLFYIGHTVQLLEMSTACLAKVIVQANVKAANLFVINTNCSSY